MEFLSSEGFNLEDIIPQDGEFESTQEVPMEEESHFPDDYDEYGGDVYPQEEEEHPLPQVDEEYPQQPENQPANQQNQRVQQVNRGYAPRQANQRNQRVQQVNRGYAPRQVNQQNQWRPANRNYASQSPVGQAYSGMSLQDMYPQMIEVAGNLMDEENNCTNEHEYDDIPVVDEEDHFAEETIEDEEYDEYPPQPEPENQQDPLQQVNQQNQGALMNPQSQRTRNNQQSQQQRVNQQSQRTRMNHQSQQVQVNRKSQRPPMNQQSQQPRVNQQNQQMQGKRSHQPAPMNQQNQQPRVNQHGQQPRANQQGPRTPVNEEGQQSQQNERPPANQQNLNRVHPTTRPQTQSSVPVNGYPQRQGAWSTDLFDSLNDVPLFCLTFWGPCITFGYIAEIVDKGSSTCSTAGGIYTLLLLFTGCHFKYSGAYRTKMRLQYGIPGDAVQDFCTHFLCESCSLVQEYKELTARGYDVPLGWHGNINLARQKQAQGIQMAPKAPNGMTR